MMVYMNDTDPDECARCEHERETSEHVIRFFDDRDPECGELCAPCVRKIHQSDNGIRSIL